MLTRLHERTLYLVRNRPRTVTYDIIADKTGLKSDWVNKFCNGKIGDPGVDKIETLYTFLTGRELEV